MQCTENKANDNWHCCKRLGRVHRDRQRTGRPLVVGHRLGPPPSPPSACHCCDCIIRKMASEGMLAMVPRSCSLQIDEMKWNEMSEKEKSGPQQCVSSKVRRSKRQLQRRSAHYRLNSLQNNKAVPCCCLANSSLMGKLISFNARPKCEWERRGFSCSKSSRGARARALKSAYLRRGVFHIVATEDERRPLKSAAQQPTERRPCIGRPQQTASVCLSIAN